MTQQPGAGAHGAGATPPAEPKVLPVGPFGQFLKDLGIKSTRLADSSGTFGLNVETLEVAPDDLEQTMRHLRTAGDIGPLDLLIMVSGVDSADTFDSVYHLWSYSDPEK